jgi:hypothetical protein
MKANKFITTKTVNTIDIDKFHEDCAYFVQCSDHGGCWFTGILTSVREDILTFTTRRGTQNLTRDDLMDPKKDYKITLLIPEDSDDDPWIKDRYFPRKDHDNE